MTRPLTVILRRRGGKLQQGAPILIDVTRLPHALSSTPMLLAVTPLPRPLTTPPVTRTYFIAAAAADGVRFYATGFDCRVP